MSIAALALRAASLAKASPGWRATSMWKASKTTPLPSSVALIPRPMPSFHGLPSWYPIDPEDALAGHAGRDVRARCSALAALPAPCQRERRQQDDGGEDPHHGSPVRQDVHGLTP